MDKNMFTSVRKCPVCGSDMGVVDTRERYNESVVWRQRQCSNPNCKYRHQTIEMILDDFDKISRKDNIVNSVIKQIDYAIKELMD